MTDYASFSHGAAVYPLATGGGNSFLRDADPALFYVLEFLSFVITRYAEGRLLQEATAAGSDQITEAVAETLPLNPDVYLTDEHIRFPLLAAYRNSSKTETIGGRKHSVDDIEVAYVLPPLTPGEAERLLPMLKAVASVVDQRVEIGMDPAYTPTGGTLGQSVWAKAGVAVAEMKGAEYGGYTIISDIFPAVRMKLELKEVSDYVFTDFELFDGADVNVDMVDSNQQTVVVDFAQVSTEPAPTLTSVTPSSGTKAGGTTVTLTGTNFVVGTTPLVWFGNVEATHVTVLSTTSVQCRTPAHDAFTTFAADVVLENADGQETTLDAGFTFTSP